MSGSHDTFDLKIVDKDSNPNAFIEFDHIVDPISYYDPANDITAGWSVVPAGSAHYIVLADAVRQPTAPNISNYINQLSNAGGTDEHNITPITESKSAINNITLWVYVATGASHGMHITFFNNRTINLTGIYAGVSTVDGWKNKTVTFADPNVIGDLSVRFTSSKDAGGANTQGFVYAWYIEVNYNATGLKPQFRNAATTST